MKEKLKGKLKMRYLKKALAIVMALIIIAGIPGGRMVVNAASASSGYTTDNNEKMEYKTSTNGLDFQGYVNDAWQQVTYGYKGFYAQTYNGTGVTVTPKVDFIADGQAIMVTYVLTNNTKATVKDFRFYVGADTMVAGNDASSNYVDEDNVVTMTNIDKKVSFFSFTTTPGGKAVAAEFKNTTVGVTYKMVTESGADPSTIVPVTSAGDSAFIIYFPKDSLLPGEVTEYTMIVGMGDTDTVDSIIASVKEALAINPEVNYAEDKLTNLAGGVRHGVICGDVKYTITTDENGCLPMEGTDDHENEYDLTGKEIMIYQKGNGNDIKSSSVTKLSLTGRPAAPELEPLTNSIEDAERDDIILSENSIKIKAEEGQEYRIDDGEWMAAGEDGYVSFTGLVYNKEYELSTRVKSTETTPPSKASNSIKVKTGKYFDDVVVNDFDGEYDNKLHKASVSTSVEGAKYAYYYNEESKTPVISDFVDNEYEFKYSGEYKIYYRIYRDGYFDKFGTMTIKIKANQLEKDDLAVDAVIDKINDIGEVEVSGTCDERIFVARNAYDALSDSLKARVSNYDELTAAEEIYYELANNITHEHKYSEYWVYEGDYHWQEVICRHKKEIEVKKTEHDWLAPVVTKEATYNEEGILTKECSVCGAKEYIPIPKIVLEQVDVSYVTHIQSFGWEKTSLQNGDVSGSVGKGKRLEAIKISVSGNDNLGIQYTTHCQSYGWLTWSANGELNGTSGEAKRLEAIKIQLTGSLKDEYDVYYRVHAQSYGWLSWAKNGEASGTAGLAKRLEAIQIVVVKKGEMVPDTYKGITPDNDKAFVVGNGANKNPEVSGADSVHVQYTTHVQSYGWQSYKLDGQYSGTTGEGKRLEAIKIELRNKDVSGSICYNTHVQSYGWQADVNNSTNWKKDGELSGTSGEAKRLEAIQIILTGDMNDMYDVYYRVHAQSVGWLSWAKNGEFAGTAGFGRRLEGIQIVIVKKGEAAPADNYMGITSNNAKAFVEK